MASIYKANLRYYSEYERSIIWQSAWLIDDEGLNNMYTHLYGHLGLCISQQTCMMNEPHQLHACNVPKR